MTPSRASVSSVQGESTMTEFIREHMASILQPFADHVDALQRSCKRLAEDLKHGEKTASEHKQQIDEQRELIAGFTSALQKTSGRAEATEAVVDRILAEKPTVEFERQQMKFQLDAVEKHLYDTANSLQGTQHALKGTDESIARLKATCEGTENTVSKKVQPAIKGLKKELDDLAAAHKDTDHLLKSTAPVGEHARQEVQSLAKACEQDQVRNQEHLASLDATNTQLLAMLKELKDRWQTSTDLYRSTNAMVGPIGTQIVELQNWLQALQGQQKSTVSGISVLQGQIVAVDTAVQKLKEDFGADGGGLGAHNLQNEIKTLHATTEEHASNLGSLEQTTKVHEGLLARADTRAVALEEGQAKLFELTRRLQEEIGTDQPPAEAPRGSVSNDIKELAVLRFQQAIHNASIKMKQAHLKSQLEETGGELEQTKSQVQRKAEELSATEARVASLESDLAATQEMVTTLKSGLDQTEAHWKGLRNGFRETHRTVAVENKMLPHVGAKRPSTTPGLPDIRHSPLTPRGGASWTAR